MSEKNFHVYENESWIGNICKAFLLCFRMSPGPSTLIRQKSSRQKNFKYCSRDGLSASISMKTLTWRSGVPAIRSTKFTSVMIVCKGEQTINLANVHLWQYSYERYFCSAEGKHEWLFSTRYEASFFCTDLSVTNFIFNFWLAACIFQGGWLHCKWIYDNSKTVTYSLLYPLRKARWCLDYAIYSCTWSYEITPLLSKSRLLSCCSMFFYCNGMLT